MTCSRFLTDLVLSPHPFYTPFCGSLRTNFETTFWDTSESFLFESGTLLPNILRLGLATAEEVDVDSLAGRLCEEAIATGSPHIPRAGSALGLGCRCNNAVYIQPLFPCASLRIQPFFRDAAFSRFSQKGFEAAFWDASESFVFERVRATREFFRQTTPDYGDTPEFTYYGRSGRTSTFPIRLGAALTAGDSETGRSDFC